MIHDLSSKMGETSGLVMMAGIVLLCATHPDKAGHRVGTALFLLGAVVFFATILVEIWT